MKAAVVNSFGSPPAFQDFQEPEAGEGETVITVAAAPLSPVVRLIAAGTHYTGGATAGFVPGVDGVGTDENGRRVYFLFPKAPFGSMAQKSLVATSRLVPVPDALSDDFAAALATAGLASWIALSRRARLIKGETVLVNGATGAAGEMALQIARYFGAKKVIGVGRNATRLDRLDADVKIPLDDKAPQSLRAEFDQGVDVVLDFIWGEPASLILNAAATNRGSPMGEPRLRYVLLGTLAGAEIPLRGDMLRSSGLELMGSATGSVAFNDFVASANELLTAAPTAGFKPSFMSVPLHQVTEIWNGDPSVRYVIQPGRH